MGLNDGTHVLPSHQDSSLAWVWRRELSYFISFSTPLPPLCIIWRARKWREDRYEDPGKRIECREVLKEKKYLQKPSQEGSETQVAHIMIWVVSNTNIYIAFALQYFFPYLALLFILFLFNYLSIFQCLRYEFNSTGRSWLLVRMFCTGWRPWRMMSLFPRDMWTKAQPPVFVISRNPQGAGGGGRKWGRASPCRVSELAVQRIVPNSSTGKETTNIITVLLS